MKKIIVTALAIILLGGNAIMGTASAQEDSRVDKLLDLLVQKQILTQDEAAGLKAEVMKPEAAKAPAPAPPVNIKGFVKVHGTWTENGTAQTNDTFRIRHARVEFSGEPTPKYAYKLGFAAERTDPILLDASITLKYSPNLSLTAGQFKAPFSRESIVSSSATDLMELAWFIDQFRAANGNELGLKVEYKPSDRFTWETGLFNGNGKNTTDSNDQKVMINRVSGKVRIGKLAIEPEFAYITAPGEDGGAAPLDVALRATAGFAPYNKLAKQWGAAAFLGDWSLKYEYMQDRFSPTGGAVRPVIADGDYLQLGYAHSKKLTSFLRFENYDENQNTTTVGDVTWYTYGLNLKRSKNVNYKLNYTVRKEAVSSDDNNRLGLEILTTF
jgi:hypothetical protein